MAGLRRAVPIVAGIRDQALRPEYARVVAGWLGLPEATVVAAVRRHGRSAPARAAGQGSRPAPAGLERDALRGILHLPAVAGPWLDSVEASAFDVPEYRGAYGVLSGAGAPAEDEPGHEWVGRVLEAAGDDAQRNLLRSLAVEPLPLRSEGEEAAERYVVSLLARLLDRDAARRLDALTARMAQPEAAASAALRRGIQEQYRAVADLRQQLQPMITAEGAP